MGQCYRGQDRFRLREILQGRPFFAERGGTKLIAAAGIPEIKAHKLTYFAASIFWRAAVFTWKGPTGDMHIDMGKYEEGFRQYLLGSAGFPAQAALLLSVSTAAKPLLICGGPYSGKVMGDFHVHTLVIPGISFRLCLGSKITPVVRRACFVRSPENFIYYSDDWDQITAREVFQTVGQVLDRFRVLQEFT